jgi:hypothetical protein
MERLHDYNFEEKAGKELEIECLDVISYDTYLKNIEKKIEQQITKAEIGKGRMEIEESLEMMKKLERESPDTYDYFKRNIVQAVRKRMSFIKKYKHAFLNDFELEEQFEIIEGSQKKGFDPTYPSRKFSSDLHDYVNESWTKQEESEDRTGIEIDYEEDLEFYTATNSHLDYSGVDAFFKLKYKNKKGEDDFVRVTFDISMLDEFGKQKQIDEKIKNGGKYLADVVLLTYGKSDYSRKDKEWTNYVKSFGSKIAEKLKDKIKNKESLN